MPPRKKEIKKLPGKCAITGQPKAWGAITSAEQHNAECCDRCGTHHPWGGPVRLRGVAGFYICPECDDKDYITDEETEGEDDDGK